ncbi:cysteine and tyrosine-rich protein 1-like [Mytilus californianus]|uniref:cysteine and tyrosine-rich protein 1-like n=1 Tax=Mytilus californianus TaxID=6549 RepID=UPI002245795A|nr:cysteine and tyrosine-rich protein 1-like [Mytilus californianus]
MIHALSILAATAMTVFADTCYKTSGSYVYSTYCSGYCSGTYGHDACVYYYTYYYYYNDAVSVVSTGVIAGIVIGCLFALGIVIAIIVVICKSVAKSSGSHGRIIQPTATSGTTVAYTNASQIGQPTYYDGNTTHLEQQPNYPSYYQPPSNGYPPNTSYPPNTGYPPSSIHTAAKPPPYSGNNLGGLAPVDIQNTKI